MQQLDLFNQGPNTTTETETDSMNDNLNDAATPEVQDLWSVERLESIPTFIKGKTNQDVLDKFNEHKHAGRDADCYAISTEWIIR